MAIKLNSGSSLSEQIVQMISDESILKDVALKYINDQNKIESIARNDLDHYVREAALDKISDNELCQEIMNSWNSEQKANTQSELKRKENKDHNNTSKVKPGCCPHCGVRLAMPPQGIPSDSVFYCSYCKKRIN